MVLPVVPAIWQVPVGIGCRMCLGRLAGITGNAYLSITGDAVMEDPWMRSELPTLQQAELSFSTGIKNASSTPKEVEVSGVIQPGNITFSKSIRVEGNETVQLSVDKE